MADTAAARVLNDFDTAMKMLADKRQHVRAVKLRIEGELERCSSRPAPAREPAEEPTLPTGRRK